MPYADPLGLVGQRLGPYVVRELATAGGVALIYRGEHETLKSAVAMKVLRPELVEDAVRPTLEQMFLREAQILSQLRSDDILRALDNGRVMCKDGAERPYIVVDWLEGVPLIEELERRQVEPGGKPYTLTEAIELLEPVARALSVCHEAGIVHRDVNPRNVFLENLGVGRPPRAKLIDFGFAKEVARTEALRLQRVDGTLFARSPDYAAPEHYDREAYGDLSENTDIYTFALMIVQMLTLRPPLRGISDAELKAATTNRADRPTPNNRGAHVSPAVEALFAEALAIDQFERPGILSEFWERLKVTSGTVPPPAPEPRAAAPAPEPRAATPEPRMAAPAPRAAAPEPRAAAPEARPAAQDVSRPSLPMDSVRPAGVPGKGTGRTLLSLLVLAVLGGVGFGAWRFTRPLVCPAGFADCNGSRSDGCEAELVRDSANCGVCGKACASGGTESCIDAKCRIAQCPPDHADCNQSTADGCETDLSKDPANCGSCGAICGAEGAKQALCTASKCKSECKTGFGDCDGAGPNGCEASLMSDAKNCGRCGVVCDGVDCKDGVCAPSVVASPVTTQSLALDRGSLYFFDGESHAIVRVAPGGEKTPVVADVTGVTALAVGDGRVAWLDGAKTAFARALDDASAAPVRLAGPLASDTPFAMSATGDVAWANRAAREERGKRSGREPLPPPTLRRVFSVPLASALEKGKTRNVECPAWPRTFAAQGPDTYCCDATKPLSRAECKGGRCTSETYDAICPDELAVDAARVYFAQDVRVLALDRATGKLKALAKRKRHPRQITLGTGYLYWLEGEPLAEIWRASLDTADKAAPELLARRQPAVTALAADADALYFVADAAGKSGRAIYRVGLPKK